MGNPPWETLEFKEKEWFAEYRPDISNASSTAIRRHLIEELKGKDPLLYSTYIDNHRKNEGENHLIRNSDRYPLTGRGKINTYSVFAETNRLILTPLEKLGVSYLQELRLMIPPNSSSKTLISKGSLVSLYDFENREGIFPGVHRSYKFCLLTLNGSGLSSANKIEFVFFALQVQDLKDNEKRFTLQSSEIELLNPNTKTCPVFRTKRDAGTGKRGLSKCSNPN